MKHHHSHKGEATTVIIIVLVLALLTALGWLFYQNFIQKETTKTETDLIVVDKNKESTKDESVKLKEICTELEGLCLSYPENLVAETSLAQGTNGPNTMDKLLIKDESGKKVVSLASGINGLGGGCVPGGGKFTYVEKTSELPIAVRNKNSTYNADNLHVTAAATEQREGGVTANVFITSSAAMSSLGKKDYCASGYANTFTGKNYIVSVGLDAYGEDNKSHTYASVDEAKRAIESSEFQRAYDILKTARYK